MPDSRIVGQELDAVSYNQESIFNPKNDYYAQKFTGKAAVAPNLIKANSNTKHI